MKIFLRRIPANTQYDDISEFIAPALKKGFFRRPGKILNIEILALQDTREGTIEYHGLVNLDSEQSVHYAINGLKNRRLNGRYVLVRPYFSRHSENDPREHFRNADSEQFIEKRQGDRRRGKYLEVIKPVVDHYDFKDEPIDVLRRQQFQAILIVPVDIEMAVAECLVSFELQHADTLGEMDKPDHRIIRFMSELEGPGKRSRRFQFFASREVITEAMDELKKQFSSNNIYYWILPVVEFGVF